MKPFLPFDHARGLLAAALGEGSIEAAYSAYIGAVLGSPLWSVDHPEGVRVPWRLARGAHDSNALREAFRCPGLYLFGTSMGVPLYWGRTQRALWSRLRGRYACGPRTQCQLAADHEKALLSKGLDGFPEGVRVWYRRITKTGTVRLHHAVAFAQHGIDGIWFTVVPVPDTDRIKVLESQVIAIARRWNQDRGYPPLLNDKA